jgi:predicted peptidase
MAVLIAAGFLRSLFFTSVNALVFADLDDARAGQATAIAAVTQQVSIALGVALAGVILEAVTTISGQPLQAGAFQIAFFIVAGVAAMAALPFWMLHPTAGNAVSGHRLGGDNARSQVLPPR